ncbi:hypothetical protein Asi03nite_18470 [Actinoplanes siamensis]|uniref:Uncharacterized protein n=1 Tax=Actinoplanes siamensis TaxID=1223317 RepID=A0A919N4L1_9ACTN|nr:hypothetical protein Asi03nite_18470 [Actinoplanes siamensis]
MGAILAVGPRKLPDHGTVQVWVDSGSGGGHEITVPANHLSVAEMDDGQSETAIYTLQARECRG